MKAEMTRTLADGSTVTLTLEQEEISVRLAVTPMKIDPDWRWTDPAGHEHDATLKKAVWKVVRVYWCEDCRDEHTDSEPVCRYCGAKVEPHRVPDYDQPDSIPRLLQGELTVSRDGMTSVYVLDATALAAFPGEFTDEWVAACQRDDWLVSRDIVFAR